MNFGINAGDTNKTIYVRLRDSTTGLGKTGLAYDDANAVCSYTLPLAARAAITLATQTVTGAHSDGGFVEVDATNCKGLYRLDLPDAAIASGAYTIISIEFDGTIEESVEVELISQTADHTAGIADVPTVAEFNARTLVAASYFDPAADAVANVTLCATTTTNTDMVGAAPTAAAVADQVWEEAIADHSGTGGSTAEALAAAGGAGDPWITALPGAYGAGTAGNILGNNLDAAVSGVPTTAEFDARTLLAAAYFDPAADTVANVTTVGTLTGHTAQTADHTAGIADIPTVAEFNARTILSAAYFDPTADAVANVTLCATTTTNTDMRGTNSAALASVCTEGRLAELDAANIPADIDAIPTTAMRGTDSAALASVCTEGRLAELDAGNLPADVAGVPAAILAAGDVDGYSLEETLKLCLSALAAKLSGAATTTITIRASDDSKDRITATVDSDGNRSAVTLDAAG